MNGTTEQDLLPTPETVSGAVVVSAEPWMWQTPVMAEEEALFTGLSSKRQAEFRAGRHCARQALSRLGLSAPAAVLRGEKGEPLWPAGYCGSISHSHEACVAMVASTISLRAVAIDVERNQPLKPGVLRRIATPEEQGMLLELATETAPGLAWEALLFSIKECVHKVYFPLNRHALGFQDVQVHLEHDVQRFVVEINKPVQQARYDVKRLQGGFSINSHYLLSWILLPA